MNLKHAQQSPSNVLASNIYEYIVESVSVHYNWEGGVKIRKNLESLENWALDNDVESAVTYLVTAVSIADFLATSKQFLLQVIPTAMLHLHLSKPLSSCLGNMVPAAESLPKIDSTSAAPSYGEL